MVRGLWLGCCARPLTLFGGGGRSEDCHLCLLGLHFRLITDDLCLVPLARVAKYFDIDKNVPDWEREASMEAF